METEPTKSVEALRTEYYVSQLAMRSIDQTIFELTQERARWSATCHAIVNQVLSQGETL